MLHQRQKQGGNIERNITDGCFVVLYYVYVHGHGNFIGSQDWNI